MHLKREGGIVAMIVRLPMQKFEYEQRYTKHRGLGTPEGSVEHTASLGLTQ